VLGGVPAETRHISSFRRPEIVFYRHAVAKNDEKRREMMMNDDRVRKLVISRNPPRLLTRFVSRRLYQGRARGPSRV
jgi:hypothetical protein